MGLRETRHFNTFPSFISQDAVRGGSRSVLLQGPRTMPPPHSPTPPAPQGEEVACLTPPPTAMSPPSGAVVADFLVVTFGDRGSFSDS